MNLFLETFLKPGTDLKKVMAGIAILLFFSAATAAATGWISVSIGSSGQAPQIQPPAQDA